MIYFLQSNDKNNRKCSSIVEMFLSYNVQWRVSGFERSVINYSFCICATTTNIHVAFKYLPNENRFHHEYRSYTSCVIG